jgi:hypothetical protein
MNGTVDGYKTYVCTPGFAHSKPDPLPDQKLGMVQVRERGQLLKFADKR